MRIINHVSEIPVEVFNAIQTAIKEKVDTIVEYIETICEENDYPSRGSNFDLMYDMYTEGLEDDVYKSFGYQFYEDHLKEKEFKEMASLHHPRRNRNKNVQKSILS